MRGHQYVIVDQDEEIVGNCWVGYGMIVGLFYREPDGSYIDEEFHKIGPPKHLFQKELVERGCILMRTITYYWQLLKGR